MRIYLPDLGFPTAPESDEIRQELGRMRTFEGTGGPFIPVPGLLKLDRVEMRGLVMEQVIERDMPIAGGAPLSRFFPLAVDCASVRRGVDGEALLYRHLWSNDGIWQKGEPVYVFGDWDLEISPAPEDPRRPAERVHRPVLTNGEVTADGEVRVRAGKSAKE